MAATVDMSDYDNSIPVSSIDFDFDEREERADDSQVYRKSSTGRQIRPGIMGAT